MYCLLLLFLYLFFLLLLFNPFYCYCRYVSNNNGCLWLFTYEWPCPFSSTSPLPSANGTTLFVYRHRSGNIAGLHQSRRLQEQSHHIQYVDRCTAVNVFFYFFGLFFPFLFSFLLVFLNQTHILPVQRFAPPPPFLPTMHWMCHVLPKYGNRGDVIVHTWPCTSNPKQACDRKPASPRPRPGIRGTQV